MEPILTFLKLQFTRSKTLPLFAVSLILLMIGLLMGVSDNLAGTILVYLGMIVLVSSLVHQWQDAGRYGNLLAISAIAVPVLLLIYNIMETLITNLGPIPVLSQLFGGVSIVAFVGGLFLAPAAGIVAIMGGLFYLVRSKM